MNPEWSRRAARLKNTDVFAEAVRHDFDVLGRFVDAVSKVESLDDVQDEEIRALLEQAAIEVRVRQSGA